MSISAYRTVTQGDLISLFIEVRNTQGILVNSESSTTISIFPFDKDPRQTTTTDADADVLSDASITNVAQGIYQYDYTVNATAHVGTWFDRWNVTIDGVLSSAILQFNITSSDPAGSTASVEEGTAALIENNVIIVTLSEDIAASDGSFLDDGFEYYFTTTYNPLYSSIRRVRLRAGAYLETVPDDTINLAIFEGSLNADALTFGMRYPPSYGRGSGSGYEIGDGRINPTFFFGNTKNGRYLKYARAEYATCMAIWFMLTNNLGPAAKKKKLADFSVEYGDGSLKRFMDDLVSECEKWEQVLQSGGHITKGASLPSRIAQKGVFDPDAPAIGRRIDARNNIPASNIKINRTNSPYMHNFGYNYRARSKHSYAPSTGR